MTVKDRSLKTVYEEVPQRMSEIHYRFFPVRKSRSWNGVCSVLWKICGITPPAKNNRNRRPYRERTLDYGIL